MAANVAFYVHIPFCRRRCLYCDFNTYAGMTELRPAYVRALLGELSRLASRYRNVRAGTLYFGGGTPSLLSPEEIISVVAAVQRHFQLLDDAEVTLEANPGTVDAAFLARLRQIGVNRLSLGVQSARDDELALLGRIHTWDEAVAAVRAARAGGFDNLSLDLIYGLPGQTLERWLESVARVLALQPEHLSLYALTLEPGTPLAEQVALGTLPAPDPDVAAEMYERASESLQQAGFWQYEISNWARGAVPAPAIWALPPGGCSESLGPWIAHHNLAYWRNEPWLGVGAGAYSWFKRRRWGNLPQPTAYIAALRARRTARMETEVIPGALERGETLMMGLRLAEGVSVKRFWARFGLDLGEMYGPVLQRLVGLGLLEWDGARARLSARGRLLGNQVFGEFLP